MSLDPDQVALSALVDLMRRGLIRDLSPEALALAQAHTQSYYAGAARFPLVTEDQAEAVIAPVMPSQLDGLGSFLKKAVKDIGSAVTKVTKAALPFAVPLLLGTNLLPIGTTILGATNPQATITGATGIFTGNPQAIMQSVAMFAQGLSTSQQQSQATMQQKAAAGERAAVLDQTAQALTARIGRNPFDAAGAALTAGYRSRLEAVTDQASLDAVVQSIAAEQDQAAKFATANGTVDATSAGGMTLQGLLPWALLGGAILLLRRK